MIHHISFYWATRFLYFSKKILKQSYHEKAKRDLSSHKNSAKQAITKRVPCIIEAPFRFFLHDEGKRATCYN
jgi:hypothetical protein